MENRAQCAMRQPASPPPAQAVAPRPFGIIEDLGPNEPGVPFARTGPARLAFPGWYAACTGQLVQPGRTRPAAGGGGMLPAW